MKNFKYILASFFIIATLIPQLALASWWNPFSWNVFKKKEVAPKVQVEVQKTPEEKISELQKQLDKLKNKKTNSTTTTQTPTKSVQKKIVTKKIEVSSESSWKAIEDYLFPIADGQGLTDFRTRNDEANDFRYYIKENNTWTWKSSGNSTVGLFGGPNQLTLVGKDVMLCNYKNYSVTSCSAGQKFYCPETGNATCLSSVAKNNTTAPSQTSNATKVTTPVLPPTADQLAGVMRLCANVIQNGTPSLIKSCDPNNGTVWEGYYSNIIFRNQIDIFVAQIDALNATKSLNSIQQKSNCYYPSSETLSKMTPWAGTFVIQNACGTATEGDKINYQMEELKDQLSGLKDTIKKNQAEAFQRPALESLQSNPQTFGGTKWEVRFEGGGNGRVFNSSGEGYSFHCDSTSCITY